MNSLISRRSNRSIRWSWLLFSVVLTATFIGLHQVTQEQIQALRDRIGSSLFHLGFGAFGALLIAACVLLSLRWIQGATATGRPPDARITRMRLGTHWVILLVVAALSYWTLVAVHSELVHLPQYMLLFIMLHAALGRVGPASAWALVASILDEGYQYWVLRAGWNSYFDFNDLILNQIGIGLGLALVLSAVPLSPHFRWRRCAHSGWLVLGLILLLLTIALGSGWLGMVRATSPDATFVLNRSGPNPTFWTHAEWSGKDFHILAPLPGLLLTGLLSVPLLFVDGWRDR